MKLTFVQPHISITSLPASGLELGKLTVITGLNGSGKSHFLQAIENGSIKNDVANTQEILRRDWSSFAVPDVGVSVAPQSRETRVAAQQIIHQRFPNGSPLKNEAIRLGIDVSNIATEAELFAIDTLEIQNLAGDNEQLKSNYMEFNNFRMQWPMRYGRDHQIQNAKAQLEPCAKLLRKDIYDLTKEDVDQDILTTENMTPFHMSFANMFDEYRSFFIANLVANNRVVRGHPTTSLTDQEFETKHGRPPWEILNEALADARMQFTINSPDLNNSRVPYIPKLTKIGTDIEIPFSALSSGERVLMTLAICVYYAKDQRLSPTYPKLILLDEVDAPLHPSMSRDMLNIIQRTLVEKHGLHVILTTHSPSTVALAPDNSIHIMTADGDRLRRASKADALNLLTDGVPTLAINFEGRRQVLVESPADAAICTKLYELFKPKLPSGRSLQFIPVGSNKRKFALGDKTGSDDNTGVDRVLIVLDSLIKAGNQTVFALVDSDVVRRTPDQEKRMQVFAKGLRNGLENCIYDPLILLLVIARHAHAELKTIGISEAFVDTEIFGKSVVDIQSMVDKIQSYVLGDVGPNSEFSEILYTGGLKLAIRQDYLLMDDHGLQDKILLEKMKFLQKIASNNHCAKQLEIVEGTMPAYPDHIPNDLYETFKDLLEWDAHV
jgi:energy-coupling factor transporter ATP-binding protein EcfA2